MAEFLASTAGLAVKGALAYSLLFAMALLLLTPWLRSFASICLVACYRSASWWVPGI
jgi:hypothetical protein